MTTDQVIDTGANYMLNDIVSANEKFVEYNNDFLPQIENYVFLGDADEDLFVYNTANGRYEVLDRTGRDVMEDFETFEAMFAGVVEPRI